MYERLIGFARRIDDTLIDTPTWGFQALYTRFEYATGIGGHWLAKGALAVWMVAVGVEAIFLGGVITWREFLLFGIGAYIMVVADFDRAHNITVVRLWDAYLLIRMVMLLTLIFYTALLPLEYYEFFRFVWMVIAYYLMACTKPPPKIARVRTKADAPSHAPT